MTPFYKERQKYKPKICEILKNLSEIELQKEKKQNQYQIKKKAENYFQKLKKMINYEKQKKYFIY